MKRVISIQLLPTRITIKETEKIVYMLYKFARKSKKIEGIKIEDNRERSKYINIHYKTKDAKDTWKKINSEILDNKRTGKALKEGSIIICEGKKGWDDYLLLHHYDKNEKTDILRGD